MTTDTESGHRPDIEHVSRETVLAPAGEVTAYHVLTGQQRAAFRLAAGVFALILATIVFDFVMFWIMLPTAPKPPSQLTSANVEMYRLLSDHYTVMSNAALDRAIKIFETCVAAAFLPVFTGMVGFIFGRERP
jgi:hypothetical protein